MCCKCNVLNPFLNLKKGVACLSVQYGAIKTFESSKVLDFHKELYLAFIVCSPLLIHFQRDVPVQSFNLCHLHLHSNLCNFDSGFIFFFLNLWN
jgi:hypothetical protein